MLILKIRIAVYHTFGGIAEIAGNVLPPMLLGLDHLHQFCVPTQGLRSVRLSHALRARIPAPSCLKLRMAAGSVQNLLRT